MIFAVDGSRLSRKPSGVTFIMVSIIKRLAYERPDFVINVILRAELHPIIKESFTEPNINFIIEPLSYFNNIGLFWSLFKLNRILNRLKFDYFLSISTYLYPFFANKKTKKIVFVHDMVFKTHPSTMSFVNKLQMNLLFKYSINNANLIWCNSEYTKAELLRYYKSHLLEKEIFVGSGLNEDFKEVLLKQPESKEIDYTNQKPYILFVGTFEPRKNISFLLQIYKNIADRYDMVLVGGNGWGSTEAEVEAILNGEGYPKEGVKILRSVQLEGLVQLYKGAFCYMTTSLNEGLGLPLLEAMSCGCPVIAAHNSAMIEVVNNAGILVSSTNTQQWVAALTEMEANRDKYVSAGYKRVDHYSWQKVIKSFINCLN